MAQYLRWNHGTVATPQSEPIPGKDMVKNSAGGYAFKVGDWGQLRRFLVLGTEGGTYYTGERELTRQNLQVVERCLQEDGQRVVREIVEISESGRAPKNDPALYALAMCAGMGSLEVKRSALAVLPKVVRIGTHLLHFVAYCKQFRGWGRGLRTAIGKWYIDRTAEQVAYQVAKYQSRDRWAQRDLLRLAHPIPPTEQHKAVFHWVTQGWESVGSEPPAEEALKLIWALERAKTATGKDRVALIRDYGLMHEMIPTEWKKDAEVWEVLLEHMPLTAMIRNLATMTRVGLLKPLSTAIGKVVKELNDVERIRKARVHPIAVLSALRTYAQGHGERSDAIWQPVGQIVDALDGAFYHCLVPETRILTANLRWVRLDDISVGEQVVAVDENVPGGKGPSRKMRSAVIEGKREQTALTLKMIMDNGQFLIATENHRFLVRKRWQTALEWRTVGSMRVGDSIRWITRPWDASELEDGWFGGFLDGEGSFQHNGLYKAGARLSVSQRAGLVHERAKEYLQNRGYAVIESQGSATNKLSNTRVLYLTVSRMNELFRLLGQTRPTRFVDLQWWIGKTLPGAKLGKGIGWSKIVSIEPAGRQRVIDIQTSTGTFIAEGFVSHNSFGNVTPTNKRWNLALDVSGSMNGGVIAGVPGLTPRVASAAMALVTANVEPNYVVTAFTASSSGYSYNRGQNTDGIKTLSISPRQRLDDVVKAISELDFGGTDCALPMLWAMQNKVRVDVFAVYTDSETWAGTIHPVQALDMYRQKMSVPARLAVIGMTSTGFSIADPMRDDMLDVVGLDTATPEIMSMFATGQL